MAKRASGSGRKAAAGERAGALRAPRAETSARTATLPEYEARRDFRVTPEPAPGAAAPSPQPTFVVHKHDATRLHYDLRLEIAGALASWSVPKGPSYDPHVKRLAVQTEDHPLEYGSFEGRIPDGEYGAGDSLIWDRGTWDTVPPGEAEKQRAKGHLHVRFEGEKLHGDWHLVRTREEGGKQQWVLFKASDAAADPSYDVVAERPESVVSGRAATRGPERKAQLAQRRPPPEKLLEAVLPPMLAQLASAPPAPARDWIYELKYDGFRALCALANGRVAMWSRNGLDLGHRFPHLVEALAKIVVGDAILDGEICVLDARGAPRFELLQKGHDQDAVFFGFDLLRLDGEDLRRRPIEERRDLLASLLSNVPSSLRLTEVLDERGTAGHEAYARALREAGERGFEGIVAKRRGSRYEAGRSSCWKKVKVLGSQEVAICGFTRVTTGADAIGALLVAVYENDGFVFAGKVGTGFTNQQRGELFRALAPEATRKPTVRGAPRSRAYSWVEPRLVAQVRFTEWTADGKLRHPSFQGIREDKRPEECVREAAPAAAAEPVERIERTTIRGTGPAVQVKLSTPERLLWPRDGFTKRDLAAYYEQVAEPMTRALRDRPLALEHWPKGIDQPSWYQQNLGDEAEPWMTLVETPTRTSERIVRHLVADRPETLRWLAQMNVLTTHMWSSRAAHLTQPDWVVFDLDPAEGAGFQGAIEAAHALRTLLEALSIPSVPKTSGKRGLHVLVPLLPGHTHEDAVAFALRIGQAVAEVLPGVTLERAKAARQGRLYLDCLQNGYGKTIVAPYSPRGVDGAPVSAPLQWSEVGPDLDPKRFTIRTMPERLSRVGDLFRPALEQGVRLPRWT